MHVIEQSELQVIVNVHIVAIHESQTVSVFELLLIRVRVDKLGSYRQIIYNPET